MRARRSISVNSESVAVYLPFEPADSYPAFIASFRGQRADVRTFQTNSRFSGA
jgi:hypothetical protein